MSRRSVPLIEALESRQHMDAAWLTKQVPTASNVDLSHYPANWQAAISNWLTGTERHLDHIYFDVSSLKIPATSWQPGIFVAHARDISTDVYQHIPFLSWGSIEKWAVVPSALDPTKTYITQAMVKVPTRYAYYVGHGSDWMKHAGTSNLEYSLTVHYQPRTPIAVTDPNFIGGLAGSAAGALIGSAVGEAAGEALGETIGSSLGEAGIPAAGIGGVIGAELGAEYGQAYGHRIGAAIESGIKHVFGW